MVKADLRFALVLALAAAALYAPTLGYDFTSWDDQAYVIENPLIRDLDAGALGKIFSSFYLANYTPLHLLCYAAVYALAGPAPWAFHALNLALHAACAVLAFSLLRRLSLPRAGAALGAAIFLTHPVQVETVAWVNQTKTLLAVLFGLASFLALDHFRRIRGRGDVAPIYGASLLLFLFALLSKPQAVAFPGAFFCLERAMGDSDRRLRLAHWIPFALLAAAGAWVAILAQASAGAVKEYGPLGPAGNILLSLVILVRYLHIAILPTDLSVLYAVPPVLAWADGRVIGAAVLLGLLAGLAWKARASDLRPWHALGLFAAPLVPVLGWVPLHIPMADRYLYLPLLAAGWLLGGLWRRTGRWGRLALWLVPLLLGVLALERMPAWRDAASVWDTEIDAHPDSALAWLGRSTFRYETGDLPGAEADLRRSLVLDAENHDAWTNLGVVLAAQGKTAEGIVAWRRALSLKPEAAMPRLLIGREHARRGEHAAARALLDAVVREQPRLAMAYWIRATARKLAGDPAGAEADLVRAVAEDPFMAEAHEALGMLREARGDRAGAREAYRDFLEGWAGDPARADAVRRRLDRLGPEAPG